MNLRKVDDRLIRCDQPNPEAWPIFGTFVKSVISLRSETDVGGYSINTECAAVEAAGMRLFSIPVGEMPWDAPTHEQIKKFLDIITWLNPTRCSHILVHCRRGADRTGVFVACYRMVVYGWSKDAAIEEANACGMSRLQVRMHEFLEHYQK